MPLDKALLDELGRRRAEEHRLAERDKMLDYVLTALKCLGWMVAGLGCIAWSFHTGDPTWGRIAFLSGVGVGNGGIMYSLAGLYRRGEKRGDW